MVPATRRALLTGAAAAVAGLAGCSGSNSSSSSSPPSDPENLETEPLTVSVRHTENAPVAWLGEKPTPTGDRRLSDHETDLIPNAETAADLGFADLDGVDELQSFVDSTDFDRETLLLESHRVDECYRLELCAVTWSASSYHTYWTQTLRPADVACSAESQDRVATLVRIPAPLDPAELNGAGSRMSRGSCSKYRTELEEADR